MSVNQRGRSASPSISLILILFLCAACNAAIPQTDAGIQATQSPGQYDVLEGTAVQFRAQGSESNPNVERYNWEIIEGEGGRLLNAENSVVTFYAPNTDADIESFRR